MYPGRMVERPTSHRRRATLAALALASAACVGLVAARALHAGFLDYRWLLWDLVLAWVPFGLALALYDGTRRGWGARRLWVCGIAWLLFLPNAPYLATEFIHLGDHPEAPVWFDGTMIGAYAALGLALGFLSLSLVQAVVAARAGVRAGWAFALGTLVLASVGIYIGRVDRFNSWDVLADPTSLLATLWDRIGSPLDDRRFVGLVAGMAGALVLTYAVLHALGWLRPVEDEPRDRRR